MRGDQTTVAVTGVPGLRHRLAAVGLDYAVIVVYLAIVTAVGWAARLLAPGLLDLRLGSPASAELSGFASSRCRSRPISSSRRPRRWAPPGARAVWACAWPPAPVGS